MAKTVYILTETQYSKAIDSLVVYASKERAVKAFTEMVNRRIAYDLFQEQSFEESVKYLKEHNDWYNAHTTTVEQYEHKWKDKQWPVRLLKQSAAAIEFEEGKDYDGLRRMYFTYLGGDGFYEDDCVVSAELEEVELQ